MLRSSRQVDALLDSDITENKNLNNDWLIDSSFEMFIKSKISKKRCAQENLDHHQKKNKLQKENSSLNRDFQDGKKSILDNCFPNQVDDRKLFLHPNHQSSSSINLLSNILKPSNDQKKNCTTENIEKSQQTNQNAQKISTSNEISRKKNSENELIKEVHAQRPKFKYFQTNFKFLDLTTPLPQCKKIKGILKTKPFQRKVKKRVHFSILNNP